MKPSKKKVAASIIILCSLAKKKKKKRSVWVRQWIQRRDSLGAFNRLMLELRIEDPAQFVNFVRMKPVDFEKLVCKVGPLAKKQDTKFRKSICVEERLAVTLRFLATGDSYATLSYLFRIPKCTISLIVPEMCQIIVVVLEKDYMLAPSTPKEWERISREFHLKWNFPKCLGAIDGKHVVIQAPAKSGSYYFNYKGQHSVVLMAIVDANYKFLIVNIGTNGRISDGGVFRDNGISQYIEEQANTIPATTLPGRKLHIPHVFIADDAFPLQPHLMKPYPFQSQGSMRIFNYRLSRARNIVENAFGIMSSVFRVLRKPLLLAPKRVDKVVLATCCLHNFLLCEKSTGYAPEGTFDRENIETGILEPGTWRNEGVRVNNLLPLTQQGTKNYSRTAKDVRDEFREYFVSPHGELLWQYNRV